MATNCISQLTFDFPRIRQAIVASFDAAHATTDAGLVLLKALDEKLGLTARLAAALHDRREPGKIRHSYTDLVRERVFALACGWEDANDAARLAHDPAHKLALDRDPITGDALAAQPTLSRFENAIDSKSLYRMGEALADLVIDTERRRRLKRRPRRITIDLDPTDDPTHGQQELSFFHGYYRSWCYLPLVATIAFDDEAEQHLVGIVLRPGNAGAADGAVSVLGRLIPKLRRAFAGTRIRVRLDGGFTEPALYTFLEDERVEYVIAIPGNSKLSKLAESRMAEARRLSDETGESAQVFDEVRYQTKRWKTERRVVIKAEVVRLGDRLPRDNARFVVTNLRHKPARVYDVYRQRGDQENRIKELKLDLALGRTSCSRFLANQFRVLLVAAAYVLMQQLRRHARGTGCEHSQVGTLRLRLLKVAAWFERSVRRVVVHLPMSFPWRREWQTLALRLGAVVT